jgi:hypothetical protein
VTGGAAWWVSTPVRFRDLSSGFVGGPSLGRPGAGKTVASRLIAARWAASDRAPVPLWLRLRDLIPRLPATGPYRLEVCDLIGAALGDAQPLLTEALLAHPLGVASRQAAERRYLHNRPGPAGTTGEQRVQATRERRAAERATATWARRNAAGLRGIAGRITALTDL